MTCMPLSDEPHISAATTLRCNHSAPSYTSHPVKTRRDTGEQPSSHCIYSRTESELETEYLAWMEKSTCSVPFSCQLKGHELRTAVVNIIWAIQMALAQMAALQSAGYWFSSVRHRPTSSHVCHSGRGNLGSETRNSVVPSSDKVQSPVWQRAHFICDDEMRNLNLIGNSTRSCSCENLSFSVENRNYVPDEISESGILPIADMYVSLTVTSSSCGEFSSVAVWHTSWAPMKGASVRCG